MSRQHIDPLEKDSHLRHWITSRVPGRATAWIWPVVALACLFAPRGAAAVVSNYDIDPRYATISFRIKAFGFLHQEGSFPNFQAHLSIDFADPHASAMSVVVDDNAIRMATPGGADMLRSSDYFDSARHPTISFLSTAVTQLSPGHVAVRGVLTIRGIAHDENVDVLVTPVAGATSSIADFTATATVNRSDFGMVANQTLLSNQITLTIHSRLQLPAQPQIESAR
jgi:polyisoprenoid-binding protein YceI